VAGGLNEGDAEIRGEGTSWNLGEAAARGLDGKGTGGVLVGLLAALLAWRGG